MKPSLNQFDRSLWNDIETWDDIKNHSSNVVVKKLLPHLLSTKNESSLSSLILISFFTLLSIGIWVYCFSTVPTELHASYQLIVSLGCSVILGSCLYCLVDIISKEDKKINSSELWIRTLAGLIIGFGLFLIYLGSGNVVTGDLSFLKKISTLGDFQRVSTQMSLMGIFSGLMLENAIEILKKKLLQINEKQTNEGK